MPFFLNKRLQISEEENSFDKDVLEEEECMSDEDNMDEDNMGSPREEEISFAPHPLPEEYQVRHHLKFNSFAKLLSYVFIAGLRDSLPL